MHSFLDDVGLQSNEYGLRVKQIGPDIKFHIGKQEEELTLRVNTAAFHGELNQLTDLIRAGVDPKNTDYDGRSPLVRIAKDFLSGYTLNNKILHA